MFERALAIQEKALDKDNPDTAYILAGFANLLFRNGEYDLTTTVTLT